MDVVVAGDLLGLLPRQLLADIVAGIQQPDSESRVRIGVALDQQGYVGLAVNRIVCDIEVVLVLTHEVQQRDLVGLGTVFHRVFVVVAEGNGPWDLAGFHRQHHVVDGLECLFGGLGARGDHVAVDQREVRLLLVQHLAHELDGAAISEVIVLSVVELDNFELAVAVEPQRRVRAAVVVATAVVVVTVAAVSAPRAEAGAGQRACRRVPRLCLRSRCKCSGDAQRSSSRQEIPAVHIEPLELLPAFWLLRVRRRIKGRIMGQGEGAPFSVSARIEPP